MSTETAENVKCLHEAFTRHAIEQLPHWKRTPDDDPILAVMGPFALSVLWLRFPGAQSEGMPAPDFETIVERILSHNEKPKLSLVWSCD